MAPGVWHLATPNITEKNTKSEFDMDEIRYSGVSRSLITNLNPPAHLDHSSEI